MCVSVGLYLSNAWNVQHEKQQLFAAISQEVINNHIKRKPLDITGSQWAPIVSFFDKLDFNPIKPIFLSNELHQTMLGGRCCSIQGVTALQLRLLNKDETSTLYQSILPKDKMILVPNIDQNEPPITQQTKGVKVSIWQSHSLLFSYIEEFNGQAR